MLAYAAHRRSARRVSPATLTLIVGGHAIALAFLITAKMEVNPFVPKPPIKITNIPMPPDPQPESKPQPQPQQAQPTTPPSHIDRPKPVIEIQDPGPTIDVGSSSTLIIPDIGPIIDTLPRPIIQDPPKPAPVKIAARFITPIEYLRPEYPDSKRRLEEEAVLRLRLQIDERGRVVAVDPVGSADPTFVTAARQHLLRYWRYKPATEDGRPVPTNMTITLRFQLED